MYERHLKNIITRETRNWKIVDEELLPYMNQRFISTPTIDKNASYANDNLNMPKHIESLRDDSIFRNLIIRLQGWLLVRLNWQDEAYSVLEHLIKDVEHEIDRLSN